LEYVSKMDELRKTTGVEGYRIQQAIRVKETVKGLSSESVRIEEHINLGENELFWKGDEAFFMQAYEAEVSQLMARQGKELKVLKNLQEQLLKDRSARKQAKRFQREIQRQSKLKDSIIHDQESAHKTAKEVKTILTGHLSKIEQLVAHIEEKHKTQIHQLAKSQDRKIADQRDLMVLQCKNLTQDEKNHYVKEFQFKINHQKTLDKKITDHLREKHSMELRHLKARLDLETTTKEELSTLRANLLVIQQQTARNRHQEYVAEKDRISDSCEAQKILKARALDNIEVSKLLASHRIQLRQMKRSQKHRIQKRMRMWALVTGRNMESSHGSNETSAAETEAEANDSKIESVGSIEVDTVAHDLTAEEEKIEKMRSNLQDLRLQHKLIMDQLFDKHQKNICSREDDLKQQMLNLEAEQNIEAGNLAQIQQQELAEANLVYLHELEMEAQVRGLENSALQERKILNSLLDNVVDGVVSINPLGRIMRFNLAAEKMFKIPANQAIGKNVKILMPKEHAASHDQYLYNYLTTGIRRVIGVGRQLNAVKSDGTVFPIQLSVNEVVEEGFHLFTAIIRDVTEQTAIDAKQELEETRKQSEIKAVQENLAAVQQNSANLLGNILPTEIAGRVLKGEIIRPEQFDSTTVFFSNIVGFEEIAANAKSHDIVNLLNDLYIFFDSVIAKYDAYKYRLESIGSAYMVASGLPTRNGDRHALEIADMSLALLSGIHSSFRVRHAQNLRLQLRVGIHTGPCVAGVVGEKTPRYCLFGDTVDAALRMESTGSAMRIQISEATFKILKNAGGYQIEKRIGEVSVKNKKMVTYWLHGKEGFDLPLPNLEDWPVVASKDSN